MKFIPPQRKISNKFAKFIVSKAAGKKLGDVLCGFRAIRKTDFLNLGLMKRRYEIEAEMVIKAVKNQMKIKEVPVSVRYDVGSSIPIKDSLKVTSYLLNEAARKSF